MERIKVRTFYIDDDICEVVFRFDPDSGKYLGDYPDFEESPRYTGGGLPWVAATQEGCAEGVNKYYPEKPCLDCGSCSFFRQELSGDLIGVCDHIKRRRQ